MKNLNIRLSDITPSEGELKYNKPLIREILLL